MSRPGITLTDKEIDTIRMMAPSHSWETIALALGRSRGFVKSNAERLGIVRHWIRSPEAVEKAKITIAAKSAEKKEDNLPWPTPTTNMKAALGKRTFEDKKLKENTSIPIPGIRLSIAAREVSVGCGALLCVEGA